MAVRRRILLGSVLAIGALGLAIVVLSDAGGSAGRDERAPDVVAEELVHRGTGDSVDRGELAEVPQPAPLGDVRPGHRAPGARRVPLHVFCAPTTHRWLGRPLERLFEVQEPGVDLVLETRSDRDCIDQLVLDNADVVLVGVELSPERSRGFEQLVVAYRIVVPIVHPSNPLDSLDHRSLRAILRGELRSWRTVGGPDLDLLPVCESRGRIQDEASRSLRVHRQAEHLAAILDSPAEILAFVAGKPGSIGFVDVVHARGVETVKILEFDHQEAGRESMERGSWPLGASIRAVVRRTSDGPARAFLAFLEGLHARRVIARQFTLPR